MDVMTKEEFAQTLLALFGAAYALELPQPDATHFAGAAKDLLLALGMTWDEQAQEYRLPSR